METIINKPQCQEAKIWELMNEISRLRQENEQLIVEKIELKEENEMLRFNNELLHNRLEQKYEENDNNEGGWTEEEFAIASEGWKKELENEWLDDEDAYLEAMNNVSIKEV